MVSRLLDILAICFVSCVGLTVGAFAVWLLTTWWVPVAIFVGFLLFMVVGALAFNRVERIIDG